MRILLVLAVIIVLWSLWGYFTSNVEQARYSVEKKADGYEIRVYPSHIVAQTTIENASYRQGLYEGFRIVAGYIFGGNTKKEGIAMTAPVVERTSVSEKVAMTAPVVTNIEGTTRTVAFVMPEKYTLETLPTPTDPRVQIVQVPEQKMAAMNMLGYATEGRVQQKKKELLELLARDGVEVVGVPSYAGYNDPWTPPWMMRNEVMVQVK